MALDLIARKQETIGIISAELRTADHELKTVRKGSRDKRIFGPSPTRDRPSLTLQK